MTSNQLQRLVWVDQRLKVLIASIENLRKMEEPENLYLKCSDKLICFVPPEVRPEIVQILIKRFETECLELKTEVEKA